MATTRARLLYQEAKQHEHPGPCGPIAMSVLTDETYLDCLGVLKEIEADHDPKKGGLYASDMVRALHHMGYDISDCTYEARLKGAKTISSASWMMRDGHFNEGRFLIQTRNHFCGVRDGIIHDWANGTKMHITAFYEVKRRA